MGSIPTSSAYGGLAQSVEQWPEREKVPSFYGIGRKSRQNAAVISGLNFALRAFYGEENGRIESNKNAVKQKRKTLAD